MQFPSHIELRIISLLKLQQGFEPGLGMFGGSELARIEAFIARPAVEQLYERCRLHWFDKLWDCNQTPPGTYT